MDMEKVDTTDLDNDTSKIKKFSEMTEDEIFEATKDDRCPNCGANPHTFEYIAYLPEFAWLECCSCGTVFCPVSRRIRKVKQVREKKRSSLITVPEGREIVTPKIVLG